MTVSSHSLAPALRLRRPRRIRRGYNSQGHRSLLHLITLALCVYPLGVLLAGPDMEKPAYKDSQRPVEERLADLLGRLTLDEKISLVSGKNVMDTMDIERLGIPSLKMTDGPHGAHWGKATCFPTGIGMAATWNPELIRRVGVALGEETRAHGRNVLLGPCINICRTPLNGRNFEAFGEDPYLVSRIAVAYIQGLQSVGVAASAKHYLANNQERDRFTVSVEVDERTLREIYMPAFKAAVVEGDALTVMTTHCKVNGAYGSANDYLQNKILKDEWGFEGLTMSDWGGTHDTVSAALGGQDLEMPGPPTAWGEALKAAVERGEVGEDVVDDKVRRILRVAFRLGLFDGTYAKDKGALLTPEHYALAREVAQEAITLLKNDGGVLPLDESRIRRLLVLGPNAETGRPGGGGSSMTTTPECMSPLEALRERCGRRIQVDFIQGVGLPGETPAISPSALVPADGKEGEHGLRGEYFKNKELRGEPVFTRIDPQIDFTWTEGPGEGLGQDDFSVRWTGKVVVPEDGEYEVGVWSDDGSRVFWDGELLVDNWGDHVPLGKSARLRLKKGEEHDIRVEYYQGFGGAMVRLGWGMPEHDIRQAAEAAATYDAAVVFIGLSPAYEGEDCDRVSMDLPGPQGELARAVAQANPNTVVVFIGGSPFVMQPWVDDVQALLCAWYPGLEGGHAIAEVLFGEVNPSGKMPVTFPKRLEDNPSYGNYPGSGGKVHYGEGLLVGYRYYDTKDVEPQVPFGHGLSYTTFEYSELAIDPETLTVSFALENTGERAGKEVAQLYVRDVESSLPRPAKELKRFEKVELGPGEKKRVTMTLDEAALSYYDPEKKAWVAEPGAFEVLVGSSSRDIRLTGRLEYTEHL